MNAFTAGDKGNGQIPADINSKITFIPAVQPLPLKC